MIKGGSEGLYAFALYSDERRYDCLSLLPIPKASGKNSTNDITYYKFETSRMEI